MQIEQYYVEQHSSQSDLEMAFEEGDGTVEGMLRYNKDLFETETVRRMVGHFLTILDGIADNPDRRLSELPWLTEAERRLVLHDWNATKADFPQGLCLHHLFERQAARTPDAIALCGDGRRLTYAELEIWSNRLAHRLRRLGAGPGTPVALYFTRSPEMIAAILGTLKAGSAYVPLDPDAPAERLRMILADTRPRLLVTAAIATGSPARSRGRGALHRRPGPTIPRATTHHGRRRAVCGATTWLTSCTPRDPRGGPRG